MIIDLHNHAGRSLNTTAKLADYLAHAKPYRVALAITEHNRLSRWGGMIQGVLILSGIEVLNDHGDSADHNEAGGTIDKGRGQLILSISAPRCPLEADYTYGPGEIFSVLLYAAAQRTAGERRGSLDQGQAPLGDEHLLRSSAMPACM